MKRRQGVEGRILERLPSTSLEFENVAEWEVLLWLLLNPS